VWFLLPLWHAEQEFYRQRKRLQGSERRDFRSGKATQDLRMLFTTQIFFHDEALLLIHPPANIVPRTPGTQRWEHWEHWEHSGAPGQS